MKKTHIIVILIFLFSSQLFAQSGNDNGYIIALDNDTLYGRIEYNIILKSKKECRFTDNNGTTFYTPSEIKGFCVDGEKYFTSQVVKDIFLQVLIKGELSLYKDGPILYLEKNGNKVLRLVQLEKRDTIDGKVSIRDDLTWKGYVNLLIFDCIQDPKVIRDLKIDERSLTQMVIDYNLCRRISYIDYIAKKPWTRVELGLTSGITRSLINNKIEYGYYHYLPDKYISFDQSLGLIFILSSPRFMNRLALQSEIEFVKTDFFSEVVKIYPVMTNFHDTYIKLTTLSFPQSLRYTVIERNIRIFVNLGLAYGVNLKRETSRESELLQGNEVFTSSGQVFDIKRIQTGLWGGVGFQKPFNKFSAGVALKYNRMNLVRDYYLSSSISHLSLSLIFNTK